MVPRVTTNQAGEVPKVDALKLIILSNPRNSCWPAPIIYWGSGINIWAKFFTLWHWHMKRSCWIQSHQFKVANAMKYPAPAHWLWPNLANINCFVFKLCQAGPSPAQQRKLYIWHQPQWNKFCQKNGFDTFPFNVGARRRGRCGVWGTWTVLPRTKFFYGLNGSSEAPSPWLVLHLTHTINVVD